MGKYFVNACFLTSSAAATSNAAFFNVRLFCNANALQLSNESMQLSMGMRCALTATHPININNIAIILFIVNSSFHRIIIVIRPRARLRLTLG